MASDSSGKWGTMSYRNIDLLASAYYRMVELSQHTDVKNSPDSSEKLGSAQDSFDLLVGYQRKRIEPVVNKMEDIKKSSSQFYVSLCFLVL